MRTALFLLLMLAIGRCPAPWCRSAAPTRTASCSTSGDNPYLAPVLDTCSSAPVHLAVVLHIYLLLFVSLVGCVVPRPMHHLDALRAKPPKTPARLERLAGFTSPATTTDGIPPLAIEAPAVLTRQGYRVSTFDRTTFGVGRARLRCGRPAT